MEIQLHHSGWKSVQLGWNSNQTVKAAVFYFPYFAHDLFLWQLGDLLNNKNFDTSLAHSCTRFPYYLGMEIYQCKDPMNNNKDCWVGQLTNTSLPQQSTSVRFSTTHFLFMFWWVDFLHQNKNTKLCLFLFEQSCLKQVDNQVSWYT